MMMMTNKVVNGQWYGHSCQWSQWSVVTVVSGHRGHGHWSVEVEKA